MSLFFRKRSIAGRFIFVRLLQVRDNPLCLLHTIKKNLFYKREKTDYAPKYKDFTFLSGQETLETLLKEGRNLARFGDGEIDFFFGFGEYPPDSDWCQRWSPALEKDLKKTLTCTDPRLLVCTLPPKIFLSSRDDTHDFAFEYNMWIDTKRMLWKHLSKGIKYGSSHIFLKKQSPDVNWNMLRDYIKDKNIVIATGRTHLLKHLKLGKKTFFIECGTENAYQRKAEIRRNIENLLQKERLDKKETIVFASLGPTAAILAREFLDEGIRLWDTGHMFEFADKNFIETTLTNKTEDL